jgi:Putative peptidoglycan binding domain/Sel1 repeat
MRTVSVRERLLPSLGGMALLLWLSAVPGWAVFEEGIQAYKHGDYATAARAWLPLAQQGDARAQFLLGSLYAQGYGVPQDYGAAVQWFRRAAEQGHVAAQYNLGVRYHEGRGVQRDPSQAAEWFRRAAQQGFARAQYNLGVLYANGDGVPRDASQAAQWLRRAADQEDPKAQYNLGLFYAQGIGVPQDYGEAYVWFTLAAARMPPGADHEQAVRNRDIVAARLTPAQLDAAQVRAGTWQPPEMPTGEAAARPLTPTAPSPPAASRLRQAQARLKAAGFDPGPPDGTLGPKTRDALRRYQRTKGLQATGELDEPTLDALHLR